MYRMAKVDVKCPFCEQTESVKSSIWERLVISVIGAKYAAEFPSPITLIAPATQV